MNKLNTKTLSTYNPNQLMSNLKQFVFNKLSYLKPYQINLINEWINNLQHINLKQVTNIKKKLTKNMPIEYITNYTYFYGYKFYVKQGKCKTYIPSPFSEKLIDIAYKNIIKYINITQNIKNSKFLILDIGTGSGALLLSLYLKLINNLYHKHPYKNINILKNFSFIATDISSCALKIAKKNTQLIKPEILTLNQILFLKTNIIFKIKDTNTKSLSAKRQKKQVHPQILTSINNSTHIIILFNKPYVTKQQYSKLEKSMYYYPKKALIETNKFKRYYRKFIQFINNVKQNKKIIYIQETRFSKYKMIPKIINKTF